MPRPFYFVASPRSRVAHMAYSIIEETRTFCGVAINKGWKWARAPRAKKRAKQVACKKCGRAMK